jgi:hypothetical protein
MARHRFKSRIVSAFLASLAAAAACGETLFTDDFVGPDLNPIWQAPLPDAPWRFGAGIAAFQGASSFSFQSLGGSSVLRLQNQLDDAQRKGWSSAANFPTDAPIIYEARVNTLVQSPSTGFDELLEIWLIDATNPERYDILALSAPGFGLERIFTAHSSITDAGLDTPFSFADNTWYRLIITGSPTQEVRASIHNDASTEELIGVNLGHTLSAYASGFKIGISQSMGLPGFTAPTDAALDSVTLTRILTDDSDGDGVPDNEDACADSDLSATVIIQGCDSEVRNTVFPSGCTIPDLVRTCGKQHGEHGKFANCAFDLAKELKEDGVITRRQKRAIQRCVTPPDHR